MSMEIIQAVGYIRESTVDQMLHGNKPEDQRRNIKRYCEKHNFHIIKWFEDAGSGGNIKKRPDFVKMVDYVKRNKIPFIVTDEMSRYFRNIKEGLDYFDQLQKDKIFVVDTELDYNPREYYERGEIPIQQWKSRTTALVDAEYELRRTKVRVKSGYRTKRSNGLYLGPLAYGLEWKDEHQKYVGYHPQESKIVVEIFRVYLTGRYGFTKLAQYLNNEGFSRTEVERKDKIVGGAKVKERHVVRKLFTLETVRTILKNKSYIGRQNMPPHLPLLTLNYQNNAIPLEPLISEDSFNRVQEMIQENRRGKPSTIDQSTSRQKRVFLLQGVGYSGVNGVRLHGQTDVTGQKEPIRRYFPKTNKSGDDAHIPSMHADEIEEKIIELLRQIKIRNPEKIEKMLREVVELTASNSRLSDKGISSTISQLRAAIKSLQKLQKSAYTFQNEILINDLTRQLQEYEGREPQAEVMKYYDFLELKNILNDITGSFERLQNLAAKKELVNILFSKLFIGEGYKEDSEYKPSVDFYFSKGSQESYTEARELKGLLQKFVPYLFEKIYVKKEVDIVNITFKPTGLFLLLNDPNRDIPQSSASSNDEGPFSPSGGFLGGNDLKS